MLPFFVMYHSAEAYDSPEFLHEDHFPPLFGDMSSSTDEASSASPSAGASSQNHLRGISIIGRNPIGIDMDVADSEHEGYFPFIHSENSNEPQKHLMSSDSIFLIKYKVIYQHLMYSWLIVCVSFGRICDLELFTVRKRVYLIPLKLC